MWRYVFMFLLCSALFGFLREASNYFVGLKDQYTGLSAWLLGVLALWCKIICLPILIFGWVFIIYRFFNRPEIQAMFYKKADVVVRSSD